MSYLLDFVKTFDPAEMKLFRQIDVVGKEEVIRDAYANHASHKNFNEQLLPKQFDLSVAHFDKINSVLLGKAIQKFYGNSYTQCLTALLKRGLAKLMLHELKIMERSAVKTQSETLSFYAAAFEALCSMFHPNYNEKEAQAYGKKYLQALGNKATIADETYVAMRIHQGTMVAQAVAGNEETYRATARAVLQQWGLKLKNSKNKLALFHLHFTQSGFVKFYGNDVAPFIEALEKCIKLLHETGEELQREYSFRVYCELSFGYIEAERFKEAERNFERAFALPYVEVTRQSYQSGNYFNVCLINKNYNKATEIFEKQLKGFLAPHVNRSVRFDMLVSAIMLNLHTANFDEAFDYLQQMRAYKRNEITQMGQILIRLCETLYFYCKHDYKMATTLAKRNVRFMSRPENRNAQFVYHLQLLNCLLYFSKQKEKGLPITPALLQQRQQLRGSLFTMFNQLI